MVLKDVRRLRRRLGLCEADHLEDAYVLPCMKLERLWPVIMHGIPELWTTREHRNAGHKGKTGRGKTGRPRWAMDCGNGQGGLFRGGCLLSEAAEHS